MTGSAFTPGPWEVGGARGYANLSGVNITTRRWGLVLAVAIGDVPELKADANARLIAAAPTMLDALVEASRFLDYFANDRRTFVGGGTPKTALALVEAAIAAALGAPAQAPDEPSEPAQ